jgi:hypothetical protein
MREHLSQPSANHRDNTKQFLQLRVTWNDDRTEEAIAEEIRGSRVQMGKNVVGKAPSVEEIKTLTNKET